MSRRRPCARAEGRVLLLLGLAFAAPSPAQAGAYVFADEGSEGRVTHPIGYSGSQSVVTVSVCIDPTSAHASEMVTSVENIVRTWNRLEPATGNVTSGANNNVPSGQYDFESVVLHELGHCIGLAHPNLGNKLPSGPDREYTQATDGANDDYDLDDGADDVIGSADDQRGDDGNLHWFRISNNNPFTLASPVDETTYSRDLGDLPGSDAYPANADRDVGSALGVANTEAVMQQGAMSGEAQRTLNHDDVAALRYAMAGIDEAAGTSDDYQLVLSYAGLSANCDVPIDFDDAQTSFASSDLMGTGLSGGHAAVSSATIYLSDASFTFFFNDVSNRQRVTALGRSGRLAAAGLLAASGLVWLGLWARRVNRAARRSR